MVSFDNAYPFSLLDTTAHCLLSVICMDCVLHRPFYILGRIFLVYIDSHRRWRFYDYGPLVRYSTTDISNYQHTLLSYPPFN